MAARRRRDPYARLLELAERELECAGRGEYAALAELADERAALIENLPQTPPADVRATLVRIALTQERTSIELQRGREQMLLALRRVVQARRAARGYGRSVGHSAAPPRVDASA